MKRYAMMPSLCAVALAAAAAASPYVAVGADGKNHWYDDCDPHCSPTPTVTATRTPVPGPTVTPAEP